MNLSPSERYARAAERARHPETELFRSGQRFDLDDFQIAACHSLEAGHSVLVAAPTGAGKTVVAEFAVFLTMRDPHAKIFYTTPIKALSNQKYQELVAEYGASEVGLLTGDTSINPQARVVVMTTEVLRNMIYVGSDLLTDLAYVVMDEVHYLADRFRGAVWEEVIIHLPSEVRLVSLSATVSNAEEFGDWLQTVRGDTDVIVSEHRPTPLYHHVLVGSRLHDLYAEKSGKKKRRVNPDLLRAVGASRAPSSRRGRGGGHRRPAARLDRGPFVELLDEAQLLPAIFFYFFRVTAVTMRFGRCAIGEFSSPRAPNVTKFAGSSMNTPARCSMKTSGCSVFTSGVRRSSGVLPLTTPVCCQFLKKWLRCFSSANC